MKGSGGLVVLQTLENGAVDDYFVILDFSADNSVIAGKRKENDNEYRNKKRKRKIQAVPTPQGATAMIEMDE